MPFWGGQRPKGFLLPVFLGSKSGLMMTRWIFTTFHSWLGLPVGLSAVRGSSGAEPEHLGWAAGSSTKARLLPFNGGCGASPLSPLGSLWHLPLDFPPSSPVRASCSPGSEAGASQS